MKQLIDRLDARLDAWGEALKGRELRFPSDLTAGIVFALVGIAMLLRSEEHTSELQSQR